MPGKVIRVFNEDMIADPDAEIRQLLESVDLPFEQACLDFHKTDRAVRTASSRQLSVLGCVLSGGRALPARARTRRAPSSAIGSALSVHRAPPSRPSTAVMRARPPAISAPRAGTSREPRRRSATAPARRALLARSTPLRGSPRACLGKRALLAKVCRAKALLPPIACAAHALRAPCGRIRTMVSRARLSARRAFRAFTRRRPPPGRLIACARRASTASPP